MTSSQCTSPITYRNIWSSSYNSGNTMTSSQDLDSDYFNESMLMDFSYLDLETKEQVPQQSNYTYTPPSMVHHNTNNKNNINVNFDNTNSTHNINTDNIDTHNIKIHNTNTHNINTDNINNHIIGINPHIISPCDNNQHQSNGNQNYNPYPNSTTSNGSSYSSPIIYRFTSYTGSQFHVPVCSKFYIIKSYNLLDINASLIHSIWTSTDLGNKRLNQAFQELKNGGKVFLFFSVNASGKFSGVCEMKSPVDFDSTSDVWVEKSRWKGIFKVKWLIIKDVPSKYFYHLKLATNEYKPVTNSRDTQEIPYDIGISMLKIISSFKIIE